MPGPTGEDATSGPSAADGASRAAQGDVARPLGAGRLPELARKAERAFNDNVEKLRNQSREARQAANEQLEHARTLVIDRVQERPFTTTLAVLGAGFLIGVLFAGRRR
jgi:ElaB/YqjD/DUF883 family membrane-anchored ribosome-binding protein